MSTDIRLDQGDGSWVVVEGNVLKSTGSDFILDSPTRRLPGGGPFRRALVHDGNDGLTINFNGDYRGGVTVMGKLAVTGDVAIGTVTSLLGVIDSLQASLSAQDTKFAQLAALVGAVEIPAWRTKTEVEEGDDMGMVSPPASELGLVIEYQIDQQNPNFQHEDVETITPPAGTVVMRGSTVVVLINLEG